MRVRGRGIVRGIVRVIGRVIGRVIVRVIVRVRGRVRGRGKIKIEIIERRGTSPGLGWIALESDYTTYL